MQLLLLFLFSKLFFLAAYSTTSNPTTVLIIDDDADLLRLASLMFKKAGYEVITAVDGLDGVSKYFMYHPRLIILDVVMPGSNGFDVCERIRKVSEDPIIMLTALNQEQDMLHGLAAGAGAFAGARTFPSRVPQGSRGLGPRPHRSGLSRRGLAHAGGGARWRGAGGLRPSSRPFLVAGDKPPDG